MCTTSSKRVTWIGFASFQGMHWVSALLRIEHLPSLLLPCLGDMPRIPADHFSGFNPPPSPNSNQPADAECYREKALKWLSECFSVTNDLMQEARRWRTNLEGYPKSKPWTSPDQNLSQKEAWEMSDACHLLETWDPHWTEAVQKIKSAEAIVKLMSSEQLNSSLLLVLLHKNLCMLRSLYANNIERLPAWIAAVLIGVSGDFLVPILQEISEATPYSGVRSAESGPQDFHEIIAENFDLSPISVLV